MINIPQSDIETLKDLLKRSGNASTVGREDLCRSIEISTNFYPRNLMLEGDDVYINSLFTYLQDMKKLKSFYKLCEKLEHHSKDTPYEYNLLRIKRIIERKLDILELVNIFRNHNFTNIFNDCNFAYQKCLLHKENIIIPSNLDKTLDKNIEILENLDNHKYDQDNNLSLLDFFVYYLKLNIHDKFPELFKELDIWQNTYQNNLDNLINIINQQEANRQNNPVENSDSCLLVTIEEGNNLIIKAWLIKNINEYCGSNDNNTWQEIPNDYKCKTKLNFRNLQRYLPGLLDNFLFNIPDGFGMVKKIQLFLPYKYIISVDTFLIERQERDIYLGAHFEVNIRFLERTRKPKNAQEIEIMYQWKDKCKNLKNTNQINFQTLENSSDRNKLIEQLNPVSATILTFALQTQTDKTIKIMNVLYNTGIPLALWVREETNNYQTELEKLSKLSCLINLSKEVKNIRKTAYNQGIQNDHIGNHLSFLWDDYDLLPPTSKLSMP